MSDAELAAIVQSPPVEIYALGHEGRDEGLLEFRRGRGISVAATPAQGSVVQKTRDLIAFARRHGYRVDELVKLINELA